MANARTTLLVPKRGESLVGGITIEPEALERYNYGQLEELLKAELKGLEQDMKSVLKAYKAKRKGK